MNQKKFYERVKLFNEIIYEINKIETNYSLELNKLVKRLDAMVEEHKQAINLKLSTEVIQKKTLNKSKTINNSENKEKDKKKNSLNNPEIIKTFSIQQEENTMVDKLISEGLQNLLNFYKNKTKLISTQVSQLGVILYKFSSTQKRYDPEDLTQRENCAKEFENNFLKFMKTKRLYFMKMCDLEIYLHKSGKDKKIIQMLNNQNVNKEDNININNIKNNTNDNLLEKENIEELIKIRQSYKKYLIKLSTSQKEYIDKINEIVNDIREFNISENNLLYDILKSFEENNLALSKEINNFCLLYEHNKKLIKEMNSEIANNLAYDERIYDNYVFEEYIPKFKNIKDHADMAAIQKMSELIGFEFDKIKINNSNNINNENIPDNIINYQNIDDNLLFILLMNKFTGGEALLNQKERKIMIKLFNDEKYIKEFVLKLNNIRMDRDIFKQKENFNILIEIFNFIFSKISLTDDKYHELVKVLMILAETYFIQKGGKKIFLTTSINIPNEIKDSEFWIKYLEYEINIESKKYENKKNSRCEYIVILSNTTHLKEFFVSKEKIEEVIEYFKNKYKFSSDEYEIVKEQLDLNS